MAGACTLNWSPVVNNVERCGGLPEEICSAAKHIMANGGGDRGRSIAAAVNFVKFVCTTGKSKNFLKSNPGHTVAPEKRARACANVAAWERLKACMKGKPPVGGKAVTGSDARDLRNMELAIDMLNMADELAQELRGRAAIAPPEESDELTEADGKALCHAGSCSSPVHEMADFYAELDGKAVVEEDEKGLTIRGLASGLTPDRENEAFEPGAFDKGIKAFMQNPVLAFFHSTATVETVKGPSKYTQLGQVKALTKTDRGLEFEAFVPKPQHGGFLANVYDQIKAGIMKGVSVGGRFYKHYTPKGWRIFNVDLQEISIAPKGVHPSALIESVEAAKAEVATPGVQWVPLEQLTEDLTTGLLQS